MKRTKIITKTKEDFCTVITLMVSSGLSFHWHEDSTPQKYTDDCWPMYTCPLYGETAINHCGINYKDRGMITLHWPEDAEKVVNLIFNKPKKYKVENVGDYSAEVTPDGIKVGCQLISVGKLHEVVAMVEEFKSDQ